MLSHCLVMVRAARPRISWRSGILVEAVLLSEGGIGSTHAVARRVGLQSRFALARLLKRDDLPALHRLAGWATVLSWVQAAERDGTSLCRLAFRARRHPSACYRLVKEVTGLRWLALRTRGSAWAEKRLIREICLSSLR
jgi:hypothetical protein